jgi:hypothetical protein
MDAAPFVIPCMNRGPDFMAEVVPVCFREDETVRGETIETLANRMLSVHLFRNARCLGETTVNSPLR